MECEDFLVPAYGQERLLRILHLLLSVGDVGLADRKERLLTERKVLLDDRIEVDDLIFLILVDVDAGELHGMVLEVLEVKRLELFDQLLLEFFCFTHFDFEGRDDG